MRKTGPILSLVLCVSLPACGDDPEGSASDSTSNGVTSATSGNTSAGSSSTGDTGSGETGGGETGDTGAPEPTQESCERYVACIGATSPIDLPAAQDGFGPGSTCWTTGPVAAQQCIDACVLGLEQANEAYPEEPKCYICQSDEECAQGVGEYCTGGRCLRSICGDGILQADELCDGQTQCSDDCMEGDNTVCNPFSDVGCEDGMFCTPDRIYDGAEHTQTICVASIACFSERPCVPGEFCDLLTEDPKAACKVSCDLNSPESCQDGLQCTPLPFPVGGIIDYLGYCT